jgi:hypothetical protein
LHDSSVILVVLVKTSTLAGNYVDHVADIYALQPTYICALCCCVNEAVDLNTNSWRASGREHLSATMKASIAVIMLVMCLYLSYVQAGRPVPRVLQNRWATAFASSSNSGGSVSNCS